eukprot:CAMPEP_0171606002 /NCGR_PEP_ID=MMETSP0990-20121206/7511_1 /TAXON_ID=483369 /ORGANISM="non described non described, Strain CCMP2098" /LENGTH=96 /DNA_ID=CAMNT_0012168771 /DNA_START=108 /DNA_END=398 /DNA_ORIENTATION=-
MTQSSSSAMKGSVSMLPSSAAANAAGAAMPTLPKEAVEAPPSSSSSEKESALSVAKEHIASISLTLLGEEPKEVSVMGFSTERTRFALNRHVGWRE